MALNDDEMLLKFTRARRLGAEIVLEVRLIRWTAGPHTPDTSWAEVERLAGGATAAEIGRRRRRLLQRRRLFRICSTCSERKPAGWMHDQHVCQGCAERTLGIIH